jgi:hypothetical protein
VETKPANLESALAQLEARGARAFDADSCDCVRTLTARADALPAPAAARLSARAGAHLQRVAERFEAARAELERRIALAEQLHGALPEERDALARGEWSALRRALRRRNNGSHAPDAAARLARRERCAEQYETALEDLLGTFAVARALDVVPEHAGPYNPLRIASDLLERIRSVSPIYLNAQLRRLEELASMLALPELPDPTAKPATRKPRAPNKAGS